MKLIDGAATVSIQFNTRTYTKIFASSNVKLNTLIFAFPSQMNPSAMEKGYSV